MRALITGFEGFQGRVNPSGLVARQLDSSNIRGVQVIGRELPEDFYQLPGIVQGLVRKIKPDIAISTGWDYISEFKVEKIALNVMNAKFGTRMVPDNVGNSPTDEVIVRKGPLALRATYPAEEIAKRLTSSGTHSRISFHAGTHCCNTVMYSLLYYSHKLRPGCLCGFIHIPPTSDMMIPNKEVKSTSLSKIKKAITTALEVCTYSL
jgi:pyroglutamyl-peptidase